VDPPRVLTPVNRGKRDESTTLALEWSPIYLPAQPTSHVQNLLPTRTDSADDSQGENGIIAPLPSETSWVLKSGETATLIFEPRGNQKVVFARKTLGRGESITLVDGRILTVQEDGRVGLREKSHSGVHQGTQADKNAGTESKTGQSSQDSRNRPKPLDYPTRTTTDAYIKDEKGVNGDKGQAGRGKKNDSANLVWNTRLLLFFTCFIILL
jgi:hypothetical protein